MDSPTLSQLLLKPRPSHKTFLYPNKETQLYEHNTGACTPSRSEKEILKTAASVPPNKIIRKSAAKSLGVRRRLRSVENSTSPFLGRRTPKCGLTVRYNKKELTPRSKTSDSHCSEKTTLSSDASLSLAPVKKGRKGTSNERHVAFVNFSETGAGTLLKNTTHTPDITKVGFKTATNKPITVSSEALEAAEKLLQQIEKETNGSEGNEIKRGSLWGKKRFSDGSLKGVSNQNKISELETNIGLQEEVKLSPTIVVTDKNNPIAELNKYVNGDLDTFSVSEPEVNEIQMPTCSSPVLRSRRRRGQSKRKTKVTNKRTATTQVKTSCDVIDSNADCSLLSDELELELLAVDLNIKFEEQCDDNKEVKMCSPSSSELRPATNLHTQVEDSKPSDSFLNVTISSKSQYSPSSCPNSELPERVYPERNIVPSTYPQSNSNDTALAANALTTITHNKSVAYEPEESSTRNNRAYLCENLHSEQEAMNQDDELLAQACAQFEKDNSAMLHFTTASKKVITISESAMTKARNMINEVGEETKSSHFVEKMCNVSVEAHKCPSFTTASNKPVVISDAALARANELLSNDDFSNFQTNVDKCDILTCKADINSTVLCSKQVDKLTNLFKGGSTCYEKRNTEYKPPSLIKISKVTPKRKHFDRKVLGSKHRNQSQIAVSDESLVRAVELLDDVLVDSRKNEAYL